MRLARFVRGPLMHAPIWPWHAALWRARRRVLHTHTCRCSPYPCASTSARACSYACPNGFSTSTACHRYACLQRLPFLNSCIDESVRLHTMLPGNTVLRKAARDVAFEGVSIPRGSYLWLYPNAVHQDPCYFEEPAKFCPMRFLSGREGGGAVAGGRGPTGGACAVPCTAAVGGGGRANAL